MFQLLRSFWKLTTYCTTSVYTAVLQWKTFALKSPSHIKTQQTDLKPDCKADLLHLVVCLGFDGKSLAWRQIPFGLCKRWSSLRGEQEDKMINVCQRGAASLTQKFSSWARRLQPGLVFKGPNRARRHVLQTTAALIWEALSTSRGSFCFTVKGLIINWWLALWLMVI